MTYRETISPADLITMAEEAARLWPDGRLKKNAVGNLSVEIDGKYVGFIDFYGRKVVDLTQDGK